MILSKCKMFVTVAPGLIELYFIILELYRVKNHAENIYQVFLTYPSGQCTFEVFYASSVIYLTGLSAATASTMDGGMAYAQLCSLSRENPIFVVILRLLSTESSFLGVEAIADWESTGRVHEWMR